MWPWKSKPDNSTRGRRRPLVRHLRIELLDRRDLLCGIGPSLYWDPLVSNVWAEPANWDDGSGLPIEERHAIPSAVTEAVFPLRERPSTVILPGDTVVDCMAVQGSTMFQGGSVVGTVRFEPPNGAAPPQVEFNNVKLYGRLSGEVSQLTLRGAELHDELALTATDEYPTARVVFDNVIATGPGLDLAVAHFSSIGGSIDVHEVTLVDTPDGQLSQAASSRAAVRVDTFSSSVDTFDFEQQHLTAR